MKRFLGITTLALSLVLFVSCKEKKSDTIIITKKKSEKPATPKTQKMGDYSQTQKVDWEGNKYTIETTLRADSTLDLATDGVTDYFDNRITIRIVRADGSEFFKRVFTKSFFKDYVDKNNYSHGALLGIVFVKVYENKLVFAASVGNPDKSSDEYTPMVLQIDKYGDASLIKDNVLDTDSGTDEYEGG